MGGQLLEAGLDRGVTTDSAFYAIEEFVQMEHNKKKL